MTVNVAKQMPKIWAFPKSPRVVAISSKMSHTLVMSPVAEKLDPVTLSLLNAPEDDEELTQMDIEAIERAQEDVREGRTVTTEELIRNLGL